MRRPRVHKTYNIGSWLVVLEFMAFTSIFTNIILFTYASDQIDHLLPFLAKWRDDSVYGVVTIFSIEHLMIIFIMLIRMVLNRSPYWVDLYYKRQQFQKDQKALNKQAKAKAAIFGARMAT